MDTATQALQEIRACTKSRLSQLSPEYGKTLCKVLSQMAGEKYDFIKYIGIGGEAVTMKVFQLPSITCQGREVLAKFCLPTETMLEAMRINEALKEEKEEKKQERYLQALNRLLPKSKRGPRVEVLTRAAMRFVRSCRIQEELFELYKPTGFRYGYFPQIFFVGEVKFPVVVMEYIPDADLVCLLENHAKIERLRFFVNLVLMVEEYLHKKRIAHCDLKAENILVKGNKPVLIDFGNHRNKGIEERLTKIDDKIGTELYLPDEMIKNAVNRGYQTDIYMLGELLVVIWNKHEPQSRLDFFKDAHSLPPSLYEIFLHCTDKSAHIYSDISELRIDAQMALVDFENQCLSDGRWEEFVQNKSYIPILKGIFAIFYGEDIPL